MTASRILKVTNRGQVQLYSNTAFKAALRAASSMAGDYTWDLPPADGVGYLASNGAGQLQLLSGTFNNQSMDDTYNFGHVITADAGAIDIQGAGGLKVTGPSVFGGGPWYDITHPSFGAVAGTDCTAAILAADAAAPAGATLLFPDNVSPYKIDAGAWLITKQRTLLSFGGAILQALPGTLISSPVISVGDGTHRVDNFRCYNLEIDGNASVCGAGLNGDLGANASSHGIKLWNVHTAWIHGCKIYNIPGDCVSLDYGDETNLNERIWILNNHLGSCYRCNVAMVGGRRVFILNNRMENYSEGGIDVEMNNPGETGNRVIIEGNDITPSSTRTNLYNSDRPWAIALKSPNGGFETSHVRIAHNYIDGLLDGANQFPVAAIQVEKFRGVSIIGNVIYKTRNGINAVSSMTDAESVGEIVGNNIREVTAEAIQVMYGYTVTANNIDGCGGAGIRCYHQYNNVVANIVRNAGQDAASTNRYSIWVEGNDNTVNDNTLIDDQGTHTAQYHIYLANGVGNNEVEHNKMVNAVVANLRFSSLNTNRVRFNRGFKTENEGPGTMLPADNSTVITHGLDITPNPQDILITISPKPTNDIGDVSIGTITSTTFTFQTRNNPGGAGMFFYWAIKSRDA
jgi:hypothetical protein